jgi:heat shock protein HslJ
MISHGPEDPMCCPTQRVVQTYALEGDRLVQASSQESQSDAGQDLNGVVWKWERLAESNDRTVVVDDPERYTLEFLPGGAVDIQADCNQGRGTYSVSGQRLSIELGPMTLAMCSPGSLHDEYIKNLNEVVSYIVEDGKLFLALRYDSGILTFSP